MDRELLHVFLRSGPARKYNVKLFTEQVRSLPPGQQAFLFQLPFLNDSIIFKSVLADDPSGLGRPVRMLVYLPYDGGKPGDGGESFVFTPDNLLSVAQVKMRSEGIDEDAYDADVRTLSILDSIPTLSPLVIELAFERARQSIPPVYLDMTPDLRTKLVSFLKSRIRPLIIAAYDRSRVNVDRAVEQMVTKLLTIEDARAIGPLAEALRIPALQAPEIFASWIGLTYFEYEYATIQHQLRGFSEWLQQPRLKLDQSSQGDRDYLNSLIQFVRGRLKQDWARVVALSRDYQQSYEGLTTRSAVKPFSDFLLSCRSKYWEMGDVLGRFEQTANIWMRYRGQLCGDGMSVRSVIAFFTLLRSLNGPPPRITQMVSMPNDTSGFAALPADLF